MISYKSFVRISNFYFFKLRLKNYPGGKTVEILLLSVCFFFQLGAYRFVSDLRFVHGDDAETSIRENLFENLK